LWGNNLGLSALAIIPAEAETGKAGHFIKNRALLFPRWFVINSKQGEKVKRSKEGEGIDNEKQIT
jgi:hypothetical protein